MSKEESDISSVGQWILGNALPWSDVIATKLVTLDVTCVEHLKERTDEEWANLFAAEPIITRRVTTRVFAGLKNMCLPARHCSGFMRTPSSVILIKEGKE